MRRQLFTIGISLLMAFQMAFAGDLDRVGTVSATELLIPVGARSISMGGATFANVSGAEAIFWNPGGISTGARAEAFFNNMRYIADINVNYIAAVYNAGTGGAFGFHIKALDFGDIDVTTVENPDGDGTTYSPTYIVAGGTYGRALTDRISAGFTGKFIYEEIQQTSASAVALDMGIQYRFNNSLAIGVVMKNIGSKMRFDGRDLETASPIPGGTPDSEDGFFSARSQEANIPSLFSFGIDYRYNVNEENSFSVSGAFANFNEASDQFYGGIEYNFKDFFFLRSGYNYESEQNDSQIFGASFGAGLSYPLGGFNFAFDYAWRQLTDYFDSNNIFTLKLTF